MRRLPRRESSGVNPGCNRAHDTGCTRYKHCHFCTTPTARPSGSDVTGKLKDFPTSLGVTRIVTAKWLLDVLRKGEAEHQPV